MPRATSLETQKPTYAIGSVDSAMRLLTMIGDRDRVRIAEAADELGVARSTAHRLMQMLVYHGFVRQEPDSRAYVAGPRLVGLGLQVVRKLDVREVARPSMESLGVKVGETVALFAMQTERSIVCLDSVVGSHALRVGSRTGVVLDAFASAAGRAILSTLPSEDINKIYPSARLPKHPRSTITRRSELLERLEVVRASGFAVQREEIEPGVSVIAAPIRAADQRASFALSVVMPSSRLGDDAVAAIGAAVVESVREIGTALGL